MKTKKEKSIQAIRKIINDIDTVEFSDQEAWQGIRLELDAVIQNFPKKITVPLKSIGLCLEGVRALTAQRGTPSFSLIEAISNALSASEHYLLDNPDKKPVIQKAEQLLKQALVKTQESTEEKPASETEQPSELSTVCLDDTGQDTRPEDPVPEDSPGTTDGQPRADNS